MTAHLVVGILGTSDPKAIEEALKAQNVDLNHVKVVTKADPAKAHEESIIDFVHVAKAMETNSYSDDMTKQTGIMADSGGTAVPGLSGSGTTLGQFSGRGAALNYFGGTGIPEDEADNFDEAIEEGRSVVLYQADDGSAATAAEAFKAAGLHNVRSY